MAFEPEYGETLATEEERGALTSQVREILGEPVRKADLYDLEQLIQAEVADELVGDVLAGTLTVPELLTDHFLRGLHRGLYGSVWEWGGRHRTLETNIGVAPERIAADLRNALDDLRYRWEDQTRDATALVEYVRVAPFGDEG